MPKLQKHNSVDSGHIFDLVENCDSKEEITVFLSGSFVNFYICPSFSLVNEPVLRTLLKTFIRNGLSSENYVLSFLSGSTRKER